MESRRYPTDLSDDEWRCIGAHLPEPTGQGRPKLHGLQAILDAVFYVLKSGCPWRLLPREFPPWKTVYDWFRRWRIDGTWERLNAELRERLRWHLGRNPNPSAGIVDSQSVRTTAVATTLNVVGPGLGQVGAAENFEAVNAFGRVVLTICMLLGRLEIFTALVLLSPAFWKR